MGRVSLSWSQVGLASVKLFEGSAYHALKVGWLLSRVSFLRSVGLDTATWREGSAYYALRVGFGFCYRARNLGQSIMLSGWGLHLHCFLKYPQLGLIWHKPSWRGPLCFGESQVGFGIYSTK